MQAVVRGRKLRQHLSLARQAAIYTHDSPQPEPHDSELDMDQMDDFLASLPDDDSPSLQPSPSASFPASALVFSYSSSHAHTSHPPLPAHAAQRGGVPCPLPVTVNGISQPAPALQAGTSFLLDPRRASHAQATSSHPQQISSIGGNLDTRLPAVHPPPSARAPAAITAQAAPAEAASSGSKMLQKQWQDGFHLPVLVPPLANAPTNNACDLSLPAIHTQPLGLSARPVDTIKWPDSSAAAAAATAAGSATTAATIAAAGADITAAATAAAAAATAQADPLYAMAGSAAAAAAVDVQGSSGERSARVSRASSSVRSEQSVISQSPDKAAAREQRHRVRRFLPHAHLASHVAIAALADATSQLCCVVDELECVVCIGSMAVESRLLSRQPCSSVS